MSRATKPPKRVNIWADSVSGSPDIVEAVYVDTGFPAPGGTPVKPPRGNVNFEFNRYDAGINYLMQRGVADWASDETDYGSFDIVRDTNGILYQLLGTATTGTHPSADPTNWYVWRRSPRAMPGDAATDPVEAWSNAKGYRITGKDHQGFDCGRIYDFRENWDDAAVIKTNTHASELFVGRWNYAIDNGGGTAGAVVTGGPWLTDLNTHPWGPMLGVTAFGQSVNAVSIVERSAMALIKTSQASLVYEVDFSVNGASGPQTDTAFAFGIGDGTIASVCDTANSGVTNQTAYGFWLEGRISGNANWLGVSKPSGGFSTATASSVAIVRDIPHRYRAVVVGTADSDDSTARVIQFLDGAQIANHTTSLNNQALFPFMRCWAHQGEACLISFGPLRIQSRLEIGDILI